MKQTSGYSLDSRVNSSSSSSLVHAMITVLSFYILFYLSSMIKTEKVVQKRPDTISTYDEILERNITPLFYQQFSEYRDFAAAPSDSLEHRVYEQAIEHGIDKTLLAAGSPSSLPALAKLIDRSAVAICPSFVQDIVVKEGCAMTRRQGLYTQLNAWINYGNSDREHLSGILTSSHLCQGQQRRLYQLLQRAFTADIIRAASKCLHYLYAPDTGTRSQRDCESNSMILSDDQSEAESLQINQFTDLFTYAAVAMAGAAFVLLSEWLWQQLRVAITGKHR